jgi:hypothetical protein
MQCEGPLQEFKLGWPALLGAMLAICTGVPPLLMYATASA